MNNKTKFTCCPILDIECLQYLYNKKIFFKLLLKLFETPAELHDGQLPIF